jgi:signal transduction histidine kinase/CheY-like chemotaxis protein
MRSSSIKGQLTLVGLATAGVALLSASVLLGVQAWLESRRQLLDRLEVTARIVGNNSTAALTFEDRTAAVEILGALRAASEVSRAVLYDKQSAIFATYRHDPLRDPGPLPDPMPASRSIHAGRATVLSPITLEGEPVGLLYLEAGTAQIDRRLAGQAAYMGLILAASLLLAQVLLRRLRDSVTHPVLELALLTKHVVATRDYSARAPAGRTDELGVLATGFNEMLEDIQKRDRRLDEHRKILEEEVVRQTSELATANRRLTAELAEQRRLQEQLTQAQKMEAVGRLAGGVAHDFNNILSVILAFVDFLVDGLESNERLRTDALEIKRAAERAVSLTRQLLAFSRKRVLLPEILKVDEVVADLSKMIGRLIGEDIELSLVAGGTAGWVRMDRAELEQVLMNLAVNARDAMPQGGKLTVAVHAKEVTESEPPEGGQPPPGRYVQIRVSDTGSGISPEILDRIFEPFFTTKPQGKGTGLGLAIVYSVVKNNGGHIEVSSELDRGTTFVIHIPRAQPPNASESTRARTAPRGGGELILLVEDDAQVRLALRRLVEGNGYRVMEAHDGDQGLQRYDSYPGTIRLVLTDLVMPGMGGLAMGKLLHARCAELPILYMTGYSEEMLSGHELPPQEMVIGKPFEAEVLLERIHDALRNGPDREETPDTPKDEV